MKRQDVIDSDVYQNLIKLDDRLAFKDLVLRVTIQLSLFFLFFYLKNDYVFFAFLFFYLSSVCFGFWGYAGIGHEFFHCRVFSSRLLNILLFNFSSALLWINPYFFKRSHAHHHFSTFSIFDAEGRSFQNWSKPYLVMYSTIDFVSMFKRIGYVLMNFFGFTWVNRKFSRVPIGVFKGAFFVLGLNISLQLILFFLFNDLWVNLAVLAMPFTGQIFNRILAQSQHIGLSSRVDEGPLYFSRTIFLPRVVEFLYGSMNFHAEHHFAPAVPYYNLKIMNNYLRAKGIDIGVDWKMFFLRDFWKLVRENK